MSGSFGWKRTSYTELNRALRVLKPFINVKKLYFLNSELILLIPKKTTLKLTSSGRLKKKL